MGTELGVWQEYFRALPYRGDRTARFLLSQSVRSREKTVKKEKIKTLKRIEKQNNFRYC